MTAPVIVDHDGILVVRDDLILGGTKARVAPGLLSGDDEWVYAGPGQGFAQLALALAAEATGKTAVFFTPQRAVPTAVTAAAMRHGLRVVWVPFGRLNVLQARARSYCEMTGARLVPFGLLLPGLGCALETLARSLPVDPAEVWVAAGSGTLASALARAWPDAQVNAVRVGAPPHLEPGARIWEAPESFTQPASGPLPPFPSVATYDAKAWRFAVAHARRDGRALFWNVAGPPIEPEPACPDRL